jgi:hypothetical protein
MCGNTVIATQSGGSVVRSSCSPARLIQFVRLESRTLLEGTATQV